MPNQRRIRRDVGSVFPVLADQRVYRSPVQGEQHQLRIDPEQAGQGRHHVDRRHVQGQCLLGEQGRHRLEDLGKSRKGVLDQQRPLQERLDPVHRPAQLLRVQDRRDSGGEPTLEIERTGKGESVDPEEHRCAPFRE